MRKMLVLLCLLAAVAGRSQTSNSNSSPESPTIAALQHSLARGIPNAEADFWAHVQQVGSPLVEPANDNVMLITFVWKGDSQTHNVVLVNTAIASSDFAQARLTHISGTNVWYRTYPSPLEARFVYELSVNDDMTPFAQVTDWGKRTSTFHSDPLNPRVFHSTIFGNRPLSYVEGPKAPSELWTTPQPGAKQGHVEQVSYASKQLERTRELWIYTPPDYENQKRSPSGLPLLLVFDGGEYVSSVPVPTILDNLIAAKRIPPMVAVFLGNVDGQRDSELNANPKFADFIATELVPWIRERYAIASSPALNIVAGSSSGGLAAAFLAHQYPNLFGNVLSQSGAHFFSPATEEEPELIPRAFSTTPLQPIRFYLEVGTLEMNRESFKGVNMVSSNRHFRDVLVAKGYRVTYREFVGGHSDLNWRSGFALGILALVGHE